MGPSGRSPDSPLALAGFVVGLAGGCNLVLGISDVPQPDDGSVAPARDTGAAVADATGSDAVAVEGDAADAAACGDGQATTDCAPCTHDCLGGACVRAQCQPVALVQDAGVSPLALAQDDSFLYWTENNDSIYRTSKTSGVSTLLYDDNGLEPVPIAVDDAGVYWGDLLGIWRCGKQDCPVSVMQLAGSANLQDVQSLAIDDVSVYWTEGAPSVLTAPKNGQTTQSGLPLWEGDASTENVTTDGKRVFFTADDGLLHGVGVDGGAPFAIGSPSFSPSYGVALDGDEVFWTVQDPRYGIVNGAPLDSLSPVPLASDLQSPGSIASDGTNLYWIATIPDAGSAEGVYTCSITSCMPTLLAAGSHYLTSIVVDDTAVYFTDQGATFTTGAVYRLAK